MRPTAEVEVALERLRLQGLKIARLLGPEQREHLSRSVQELAEAVLDAAGELYTDGYRWEQRARLLAYQLCLRGGGDAETILARTLPETEDLSA